MLANQKQTSLSTLSIQIAELCQLCLTFETRIAQIRQNLFNTYYITPSILWGIVFSSKTNKASKEHLHNFMHKYGSNVKIQQCQLIMKRYSGYKDDNVNSQDFWAIFRPKDLAMVEQIVKMREIKGTFLPGLEFDFRAKQIIVKIIQKTIEYEQYAEKMRQNIGIHSQQFNQFKLQKIQAKQLQLFLIKHLPQIRIKQCETILQHIFSLHKNETKQFYSFFLPKQKKVSKNPLQQISSLSKKQKVQTDLQLFHKSNKMWKYGKMYGKHSSPLYLS